MATWLLILIFLLFIIGLNSNTIFASPILLDSSFRIEPVFSGPFKPTNFAFLGQNDILALERDTGKVIRILKGSVVPEPLLDVKVATIGYRALLGIDILKVKSNQTLVFLYYTESVRNDGDDEPDKGALKPLGNRLYRYELVNEKLTNPKLLLDLPVDPGPRHTGGEVAIGPDNNVYLTVGDLDGTFKKHFDTKSQNYQNGTSVDGRAGILRITQDGKPVQNGIIGNTYPLNLYFAYGIRNSFGIDWDPITGKLWDTENGPHFGDEINLVQPGFNSGWVKVQGIWSPKFEQMGEISHKPKGLVSFGGKGKYSEPEFIWIPTVAPTALKFFSSDKYSTRYKNSLFVADANTGTIYHFELNLNRTSLKLEGLLKDKIANNMLELKNVTFATSFGRITDLELGPDGYLYVLSSKDNLANIDRIVPK